MAQMNFDYLEKISDFKQLYSFCHNAEELAVSQSAMSAVESRNALESIVKSFYLAKYGAYPEGATLFELVSDGCFSSYLDDSLLHCVHFVRQVGNNGAHGETVSKKEAITSLSCLYEIVEQLLYFLGVHSDFPKFDSSVYDLPIADIHQPLKIEENPVISPDKEILEKYKGNVEASVKIQAAIDLTEAETREQFIDLALKEAGWSIWPMKGVVKAGHACIEIKLAGMPNNGEVGFADYVLFDDDGKPLAVIEAKKTSVDEIKGSQQAKLYADCIQKIWGVRPIIFYTNGFTIKVVDAAGYPARRVFGYYTKQELHSMLIRKYSEISDTRINPFISDRYFIQNATTAVCESFNSKRRKALVVMATGTGKTRCAISIVDVLQKFNWAKHVLFLADRTPLVNQAKNAFVKYLPDSTICAISEHDDEKRDYDARVILSTYQTMIHLIDCEDKKYGIAHFDLIIADEAHRSIYNKYLAVFNYFDSLVLGLTATPREQVDMSTYELFDLPKGEPTFAYDYQTAVKEGFLVNFHPFERTTKLLKSGLKYDDLSDEEKEQYENLFANEDGDIPKEIDAEEFRSHIMNQDTIDRVLETVMKEGLHLHSGETLGKTIIFAANHFHAQKIVERFKILYPEKGDGYCKLIDNYVNYSQSLIDEFYVEDNDFRIAVSVDMLDTGVDIPEVTNLVFFKPVFSKIKFWQMIGRGTRICKDLDVFSPSKDYFEGREENPVVEKHEDKQGFYIFDFCGVFDFFRMHPDGRDAATSLNVSQTIFNLKIDMVLELQKQEHQENEEHKVFYVQYRDELEKKIQKLNRNLINVRTAIKYVEKYSIDDNWEYLSLLEAKEIKKQITPLIDPDSDDEVAKYFDLKIFRMELDEIVGDKDYSKEIQKVTTICGYLLQLLSVPEIAEKKEFIKSVLQNSFWEKINLAKLEKVRTEIRDLVKYLEKRHRLIIESNFEDSVIVLKGQLPPVPRFKNYKQRVLDYLTEHADSGAIYKIRHLEQLTEDDVEELKKILCSDLGTQDEYNSVSNGHDFGVFVRSIVGLDRETINACLNDYITRYNFNSRQQEYIRQIVDFVRENGDIVPQDLIDSEPFRRVEYTDIFADAQPLYQLVNRLHQSIVAKA
jgi:type I restriction enzyme, R subunit